MGEATPRGPRGEGVVRFDMYDDNDKSPVHEELDIEGSEEEYNWTFHDIQREMEETRTTLDQIRKEKQYMETQKQTKALVKEQMKMQNELTQYEVQLQEFKRLKGLRREYADMLQQRELLKQELLRMGQTNEDLRESEWKRMYQQQNSLLRVDRQLGGVNQVIEDHEGQLGRLIEELERINQNRDSQRAPELQISVHQEQRALAKAQQEKAVLERERERLEQEKSRLKDELEEMNEKMGRDERGMEKLKDELKMKDRRWWIMNKDFAKYRDVYHDLMKDLNKHRHENNEQLRNAKQLHAEQIIIHEKRVAALEAALKKANEQNTGADDVKQLKEQLANAQNELKKANQAKNSSNTLGGGSSSLPPRPKTAHVTRQHVTGHAGELEEVKSELREWGKTLKIPSAHTSPQGRPADDTGTRQGRPGRGGINIRHVMQKLHNAFDDDSSTEEDIARHQAAMSTRDAQRVMGVD